VLIFFLLSGILISFTLIERSKQPSYGFGTFLLERFARIYSGLVPALMLIVVVDGIFAANKADALATGSRILRPELRSSQSFIRVVKNRG
jgi:peptidoglycan/LPS O-acetylase OafA/YrhL